ncbi:MAG TPA: hypothetical protein VLK65_20160 [Vicinamibacteria bacterium]|nr:hypothetical protein [Vicinamibacteria bacterium]
MTRIYFPELLENLGALTGSLLTDRTDRVTFENNRLDLDFSLIDGTKGEWLRVPGVTFLRPGPNVTGRVPERSGDWWALCGDDELRAVTVEEKPFEDECSRGIDVSARECKARLLV